ncbi:Hypothetical predicted protein, partial [Paramuricea clavata]
MSDLTAPRGRLNGYGWRGGSSIDMWYQVDFIKRAKVTAIKTQGETSSYYVKIFKLSYSNNGIDFHEYVDVMRTK